MKRLAHGPLLFWAAVAATLVVLSVVVVSVGVSPGRRTFTPAQNSAVPAGQDAAVSTVLQALTAIPSLAAEPRDVSGYTADLVSLSSKYASVSTDPQMKSAWSAFASAAEQLGAVDPVDGDDFRVALANLSAAGDRLVAATSGVDLVRPPAPRIGLVDSSPTSSLPLPASTSDVLLPAG
jgi:hypothetical protein